LPLAVGAVLAQVVAVPMVNLPTGTARRKRLVGELDNPIENIRKNKYDDINKGKVQTIHSGW
jgi:hypothetical protein